MQNLDDEAFEKDGIRDDYVEKMSDYIYEAFKKIPKLEIKIPKDDVGIQRRLYAGLLAESEKVADPTMPNKAWSDLLIDIHKATRLAIDKHIQVNSVLINDKYVKVRPDSISVGGHMFDVPPIVCGLDCYFVNDLPDNVMFCVLENKGRSERDRIIDDAVEGTVRTMYDYMESLMRDFMDDDDGINMKFCEFESNMKNFIRDNFKIDL